MQNQSKNTITFDTQLKTALIKIILNYKLLLNFDANFQLLFINSHVKLQIARATLHHLVTLTNSIQANFLTFKWKEFVGRIIQSYTN